MQTETSVVRRWGGLHIALAASLVLNMAVGYGYWRMRTELAQPMPVQEVVKRLQLRPQQADMLVALRGRVRADLERSLGAIGEDERRRLTTLLATVAADDDAALTRELGALAQHRLALQLRIVGETLRFRDGLDTAQRARFTQALTQRGFVAQLAGLTPAQTGSR